MKKTNVLADTCNPTSHGGHEQDDSLHTEKELDDSECVCIVRVGEDVEKGSHGRLNRAGVT